MSKGGKAEPFVKAAKSDTAQDFDDRVTYQHATLAATLQAAQMRPGGVSATGPATGAGPQAVMGGGEADERAG
jgi:hypothetical protein